MTSMEGKLNRVFLCKRGRKLNRMADQKPACFAVSLNAYNFFNLVKKSSSTQSAVTAPHTHRSKIIIFMDDG